MTIDERIEALTHSVELLSQMHQDNEKRYASYFGTIAEAIRRLTDIAADHEGRISDLENGNDH